MKILNLYCGIGGNRRLWGNEHQITAIDINESICKIYKDLFPNDTVICANAHEYLLKHFNEYDFIWTSTPCPTHSRLGLLNYNLGHELKYPDMSLYQEIIILKNFFKGKFVCENVKSYYKPLITPKVIGRHFFWSNFLISNIEIKKDIEIKGATGLTANVRMKKANYDIKNFYGYNGDKRTLFKNCVEPEIGLHILNCAQKIITRTNIKQTELF